MTNHWANAPEKVKTNKRERFNYIMEKIASSSDDEEESSPSTQDINFTITDGTNPINGATVKISSTTKTTDAQGECTFNDITEGDVSVEISKTGYITKTETITVSSNNTSFTITLISEETYYFKSYGDSEGATEWGTGTVKTTGVTNNGYSQVEVITNSPEESFIGQKFYVLSNAETDGTTLYQLYSDAGTTATGIYVKISDNAFE